MRNAKAILRTLARTRPGLAATAVALASLLVPAAAAAAEDTTQFAVNAGSLSFGASPDVPDLPALTLSGQDQTLNQQMTGFSIDDASGAAAGYNVTVAGDDGPGKSPVFKQYDPVSETYGSVALAANSLTLDSSGAEFLPQGGTSGTPPLHQCDGGCFLDSAGPVEVASAAAGTGMGTFASSGYSATSLALAAPTTLTAPPGGHVYRLDLVWSLNSGP